MKQFNKLYSRIPRADSADHGRKKARIGKRHAEVVPEYLARDCGIEHWLEKAWYQNHVQSFLDFSIRFI